MSNELFNGGGYNLDFFQLYNWGTFNKKVFTLTADNASTVLIGDNGTGKTTIVDAFLTLLVPTDKRYYNQSSGEKNTKDRSEETYVLGAYGNKLDKNEGVGYELHDYHRKKEDTISILNGCFTNPFENRSYTLTQIRYYTASNIVQVYAITEDKIKIEDMQKVLREHNVEMVKNTVWKKVLSENLSTVFYPNFKQYSSAFQTFFGLRSAKALKLFSQIVGMKVLGDINEFIKYNMLEEGNIFTEYENLLQNYETLLSCSNEIKKTKVQIEKFKEVKESGDKYKEEEKKNKKFNLLKSVMPYFYAQYGNDFLKDRNDALNKDLANKNREIDNIQQDIKKIEKEIESINTSINQNSVKIRLDEINRSIEELNDKKARISNARSSYESYIASLKLTSPESEKAFNLNKDKIEERQKKESEKQSQTFDNLRLVLNNIDENEKRRYEIQEELLSLGNRDSNIPTKNVDIRDAICRGIKCDIEAIPFVGELIEVKESEEYWKEAIEKVLHNVALTLIVPDKLYKKVSSFVNENDMKGRVVYLQAENDPFTLSDDDEVLFEEGTIGSKLNFKETNENITFLKNYIKTHFSYTCTNDINEYAKCKKAVTPSGLIKSGLKNEKDDRRKYNGKENYVLGWSNRNKKALLSKALEELMSENAQYKSEKEKYEKAEEISKSIQENCHDALKYQFFEEVDVKSLVSQIEDKNKAKDSLLKENQGLKKLEEERESKRREKEDKNALKSKVDQAIGEIKSDIKKTEQELNELNAVPLEYTSEVKDALKLLEAEYPRLSKPKNYDELKQNHRTLEERIDSSLSTSNRSLGTLNANLIKNMNQALTPPKEIRDLYGDWSVEFPNLIAETPYIDDFIKVYNRLLKDDLPRYTQKFHEYLHNSLQDDFTNFQGCIKNQKDDIKKAIDSLNRELSRITYSQEKNTYLKLEMNNRNDVDLKKFNKLLNDARPNAFDMALNDTEKEEQQFEKIQLLIDTLNNDERFKRKVLDIRNQFIYGATENSRDTGEQIQYYTSSSSISGGEKTKLTYTIVGAAIAYQFGIAANEDNKPSFRFVIIDEAFSKIDPKNSVKVMEILKELDIQVMAVTPVNNISIIENFIHSIHYTEKGADYQSVVHHLSIREFEEQKDDIIRRTEEKS